jgi:hypothetical protein
LDIAKKLAQDMNRLMYGAMTNNVEPPPSAPLNMASVLKMIQDAGPPPPPKLGKIIESVHYVERHEDWSKARSPSRTKRRMRHNATRIYTYTPRKDAMQLPDGSLVMHPVTARHFRNRTEST